MNKIKLGHTYIKVQNGMINIDTLLWGKKYRLNALLKFQNTLSQKYLINNDPNTLLDDLHFA